MTGGSGAGAAGQGGAEIVGRGVADGARLFKTWYEELTAASARGEPTAYVFVMGSLAELLRSFGLVPVFPEINALQTAVRRVAHEYLNEAEDYGYSPDICGYVKADVALQLRRGRHPMGCIPPPSIAVLTTACSTYVKWAEIWERLYGIPVFVLDVPVSRTAGGVLQPAADHDRAYVRHQVIELVSLLERTTGRRFDIDRLRETMAHANGMTRCWHRILELNRQVPAVFNAVTDGTVFLGVVNGFRGTPEGSAYFRDLVEELELKAAHGLGTLHDERYRLVFAGVPCYPIFRRFNEMFAGSGGAFVASTYLSFASGGAGLGCEYDLAHPLESLADGLLAGVRHATDSMFFSDRLIGGLIEPFRVDGVVFHGIKSCRTVSTGLADSRRALMTGVDVPSLLIESDMMDRRVVSEAQLKNRADAFFEGLETRRLLAGREPSSPGPGGSRSGQERAREPGP